MDQLNLNLPETVSHFEPHNYAKARYLGNIADASAPIPEHESCRKPNDATDEEPEL